MIWRLLLMLFMSAQPSTNVRALPPTGEPEVYAAVYDFDFLPYVVSNVTIAGAGATRYGYASPQQRQYSVPFYDWGQYPWHCTNPNYWPMSRGQMFHDISICDNGDRYLLIYNEPELGSFSASPAQAAAFVNGWAAEWGGPIACCGNFYDRVMGAQYSGLEWMQAFVASYRLLYGTVPPIDAIHLHVYEYRQLNTVELTEWRQLADEYGWWVFVTESGTFPSSQYTPAEVAERLPVFYDELIDVLQPDMLMWFSDFIPPGALGPTQARWENLNLTNEDGTITPVGAAWQTYTGHIIAEMRVD